MADAEQIAVMKAQLERLELLLTRSLNHQNIEFLRIEIETELAATGRLYSDSEPIENRYLQFMDQASD